ncbi:MAG: transcription termination/antitermination protein NusA [Nitrospirae bacterium]|nr:transcription termination/antitermination protein NusA [Nitrospirota bacterium]
MSRELVQLIDQMSRERGIARDVLIANLEAALQSAARRKYGNQSNINLRIDMTSGQIVAHTVRTVVETVTDPKCEISLDDARKLDPEFQMDDTIEDELNLQDFGRIAAQTAKQVLFQKVRDSERDVIFSEFKSRVGDVVSGTVARREKGSIYITIGKTEGILPVKASIPGENLRRGDIVKAYIEKVESTQRGPVIQLSRTRPEFVSALFRMEVPEIAEGIVSISNIVREPGDRTKMSVTSKDRMVDPVGACVGMKGTRVQSIVRELRGEKIDIIPWTGDLRLFISKSLSPATIDRIAINEEEKSAMAIVAEGQLPLAIGRRGQNVRLAIKLTGWEIDIISDKEYDRLRNDQIEESIRRESDASEAEMAKMARSAQEPE